MVTFLKLLNTNHGNCKCGLKLEVVLILNLSKSECLSKGKTLM